MSPSEGDDLVLSVPFSGKETRSLSTRYHWRNWKRGKDRFVIIQQTLSGEGCFSMAGQTWRVPAGHAFIALVPERSEYFLPADSAQPWSFRWLNFYGNFSHALWKGFRNTWGCVLPLPLDSEASEALYRLAESPDDRATDRFQHGANCYAALMKWMRLLSRPLNIPEDPVAIAVNSCKTRFREPLGVKTLASEAGMSREHFTRIFTARMGVPPALYLRQHRLAAARELLSSTSLPLREIAMRCGLSSTRPLKPLRPHR